MACLNDDGDVMLDGVPKLLGVGRGGVFLLPLSASGSEECGVEEGVAVGWDFGQGRATEEEEDGKEEEEEKKKKREEELDGTGLLGETLAETEVEEGEQGGGAGEALAGTWHFRGRGGEGPSRAGRADGDRARWLQYHCYGQAHVVEAEGRRWKSDRDNKL